MYPIPSATHPDIGNSGDGDSFAADDGGLFRSVEVFDLDTDLAAGFTLEAEDTCSVVNPWHPFRQWPGSLSPILRPARSAGEP